MNALKKLRYSVINLPEGAKLNKRTGVISWAIEGGESPIVFHGMDNGKWVLKEAK